MFDQVIFFNLFGAGDIFESREFVKSWMEKVPAHSYHYAHGKHPRILKDIEGLQFKEVTHHMKATMDVVDDLNGNLYVNTWIGRNGKYVLPGIGCTVEKLFEMHNEMLKKAGFGSLDRSPRDYIPVINYKTYYFKDIDTFVKKHTGRKVLIDNGIVQSMQASNFDINSIISEVAIRNPNIVFVLSKPLPTMLDNTFNIGQIINDKEIGFDLNEFSYLSTFCDVLIGRNSGPHVFTQVKENCDNPNKKLLSFTYHQQGSSFAVNTDVQIKKYWSPETGFNEVLRKIEEVINE